VELHGNLFRSRCTREGTVHEDRVDEALGAGRLPRCPDCGALLRPGVVWFGEALPEAALEGARAAVTECDVLLSVGTSHQVFPAAALPSLALASGATVAVINLDPGGSERVRGIKYLIGHAGELLPALVKKAWD
jgi:NAD-dependent deacetylase